MTYTEKELDQFLHGISLSLLSKKSAQHWRYDEETAKEIEWLEALERKVRADKADRKTEPTISKMEQVDKDINVRSKDEPQTEVKIEPSWVGETYGHFDDEQSGKESHLYGKNANSVIMDESQTDCAWR